MKIIQITVAETVHEHQICDVLYVLSDDGSVWLMINPWDVEHRRWQKLPDLPKTK